MAGITGSAVARDFAMDMGATHLCVFEVFQHQHGGCLRNDQTIALGIKRSAGAGGVGIARKHTQIGPAAEDAATNRRIGPSRQHDGVIAMLNASECLA